jgi:peptidoglycan biosynthesis protein MviN/MurJ (putative lipid II flippase)
MLVLRQGPFLLRANIILLLVGLLASYAGSQVWGIPGAVAGIIVGSILAISLIYMRASRLVDLPISALQDWRTIARIGGAVIIAGLAAYLTLLLIPPALGHVLAILVSGVVFCCAYLPSLIGLGQWGLLAGLFGLAPDSLRLLRERSGR